MPINVGKNAGIVYTDQDQIYTFYNSSVTNEQQDLYFFDNKNSASPRYQITPSTYLNKRCLHYNTFSPIVMYQHLNHLVLFVQNGVASPLFQTMNVSAFKSQDSFTITFWSVLQPGKSCKIEQSQAKYDISLLGKNFTQNKKNYVYAYDPAIIQKFSQLQLQDYQLQTQYKNIFCSAYVETSNYLVSTTNSVKNAKEQQVLFINLPPKVLEQQTDNYPVLDFTIEKSGGMKQHQHIPYVDGTGYAFAVFHPGTSMPQLSWLSV